MAEVKRGVRDVCRSAGEDVKGGWVVWRSVEGGEGRCGERCGGK